MVILMSQSDKIAKAQAVLQAAEEAVRVCEAEIQGTKEKLAELKHNFAEKQASLSLAKQVFSIFEESDDETSPSKAVPKRRMRLGAKKRAIYTLVAKRASTIEMVETHLTVLNKTDIDRRYIRDVIRDAISDGDMQGEIDNQFIISEDGREILEKAPIPTGWEAYKDAAEMRQTVRGVPSQPPKENEPPEGGSEAGETAISPERAAELEDEALNGLI